MTFQNITTILNLVPGNGRVLSNIDFFPTKHEFIDYAISKTIEPYKEVTTRLISIINEDAYKRKERLVESLCQLIKEEIVQ